MKLKQGIIVLVSALLVSLTSCVSYQNVELKNIGKLEVQSFSGNSVIVKITATVNNPNSRINIKSSELHLIYKNDEVANIIQTAPIVLERKTEKSYTTVLKVDFTNFKGGVLSAMSAFGKKKTQIFLNGHLKVSSGLFCKTITFSNYPVQL